ncbi:hypothetical protein BOX15_Mlig009157g2, partial [Macrostomum lignano]
SQMRQLPAATARMLSSGQVILGPESVVKELIENALDAGATRVDVRLDSCGLDRLEVLDNGRGFSASDADLVAMRHCTSKLADDSGLADLVTYGFRGEALNSLCTVGQLSMATRCQGEELGREYAFDKSGQVVSRRDVAMPIGTRVTVRQLFHCLPVRRQQLRSAKRLREALASVEAAIRSAALANPGVRFALLSDGEALLSLPECASLNDRVRQVLSYAVWQQMQRLDCQIDNAVGGRVVAFVPASGADKAMLFRNGDLHSFFIVNRRPVQSAKLVKMIRSTISSAFGVPTKLPVCVLSIELPADALDVNLNAAKTQIGLANEAAVLESIRTMLLDTVPNQSLATVSNTVATTADIVVANNNNAPDSIVSNAYNKDVRADAAGAAAESHLPTSPVAPSAESPDQTEQQQHQQQQQQQHQQQQQQPQQQQQQQQQHQQQQHQKQQQQQQHQQQQQQQHHQQQHQQQQHQHQQQQHQQQQQQQHQQQQQQQQQPMPSAVDIFDPTAVAMQGGGGGADLMQQLIDLTAIDDNSREDSSVADHLAESPVPRRRLQPDLEAAPVGDKPRSAKRPRPEPADQASDVAAPPPAMPTYSDLASIHRRRCRLPARCSADRLSQLFESLQAADAFCYSISGIYPSAVRYVGQLADYGFVIGVDSTGALYAFRAASSTDAGQADNTAVYTRMQEQINNGNGKLLARLASE